MRRRKMDKNKNIAMRKRVVWCYDCCIRCATFLTLPRLMIMTTMMALNESNKGSIKLSISIPGIKLRRDRNK